jgi:superfamily II DNA/RNA helicase
MKPINELLEEEREMNDGPVRQANIPVQVTGGKEDGERYAIQTFESINLTEEIRRTLKAINYITPTNLQKFVIPLIQQTKSFVFVL